MTDQQKREIAELYRDKANKVTDIAAAYGCSHKTVRDIAIAAGVEPRQKSHGSKSQHLRKCPKCNSKVTVVGAKFCPFCGADIRSEKDLLIEKVQRLSGVLMMLPAGERDKARDTIQDILSYLRKEA